MIIEQAKVCCMNVDRTLATWTRTSLSLLVMGVILDRYGVLLGPRLHPATPLAPDPLFGASGMALVVLGTLMALVTAIRHQAYRRRWKRAFAGFDGFGPWLAFAFAAGTATVGGLLAMTLLACRL